MASRRKQKKRRKPARYPDISAWLPGSCALLLLLFIAGGGFSPLSGGASAALFVGALSLVVSLGFTSFALLRPGGRIGPVLVLSWLPLLWGFYLLCFPVLPQVIVIPALYFAWIGMSLPLWWFLGAFMLLGVMEGGLFLNGHHDQVMVIFNLAAVLSAGFAFLLFIRTRVHRRRLRQEAARQRHFEEVHEQALELGLNSEGDSLRLVMDEATNRGPEVSYREQTVENISRGCDLLLELLRRSLGLTTVAVLWTSPDGSELRLRYLATSRGDIDTGPYPPGSGICGGVGSERGELFLAPVRTSRTMLPYYLSNEGVGAAAAILVPSFSDKSGDRLGIICADREGDEPWLDAELDTLRLAARHLARDIEMGRMLLRMDRERGNIQLLCLGLNNLNQGLGLDSVLDEAVRAVKNLIPADFVVITLFEEGRLRNFRATGKGEEHLNGLEFEVDQGLVGRVFRDGIILPAGCRHRGNVPIFAPGDKFGPTPSLICLPLKNEADETFGVLSVGRDEEGVFSRERQDILALISTQVAVKIDLGRAHEKINLLASTDPLTGLANRRTLEHGLEVMLERAARLDTSLAVIMVDIDYFKQVNDNYGHACGDEALKAVAGLLAGAVRNVDLAARYGGEEFALVLENTDVRGAEKLAERIRAAVEAMAVACEGQEIKVTISMGIAICPGHGDDPETLLARADEALYRAKEAGRNRVEIAP